jgi:5-methylcytosine-specific restriction endonuclease McrA
LTILTIVSGIAFLVVRTWGAAALFAAVLLLQVILIASERQAADRQAAVKRNVIAKATHEFPPPAECPACAEQTWRLVEVSPNRKSAQWQCEHCGKKQRSTYHAALGSADREREPIPEAVRKAVWLRDSGKCRLCGSAFDIQYDHIIPFSRGGAATMENLQILCGNCNRRKANRI